MKKTQVNMRRLAGLLGGVMALALFLAPPTHAADESGNFALRGFGAQACSVATESLKSNPQLAGVAIAWLQGYGTAFNRMQSGTFDVSPLTDAASLFRMITGLCAKAPNNRVETVAFDLLKLLAGARVTESSPLLEIKSGERVTRLRQETLVKVQEGLKERGYLTGSADGAYGAQTETALKAFQTEQDLPVTGVADPATILRILVELPARE